jgi:hypothetical protein
MNAAEEHRSFNAVYFRSNKRNESRWMAPRTQVLHLTVPRRKAVLLAATIERRQQLGFIRTPNGRRADFNSEKMAVPKSRRRASVKFRRLTLAR